MNIAILGDQTFADYNIIKTALLRLIPRLTRCETAKCVPGIFYTGGSTGCEAIAETILAEEFNGWEVRSLKPAWRLLGSKAGISRSRTIACSVDAAIIFSADPDDRETEIKLNFLFEAGVMAIVVDAAGHARLPDWDL